MTFPLPTEGAGAFRPLNGVIEERAFRPGPYPFSYAKAYDPSLLAQPSRSDMPPVSPRALAAPGSPRYTYRTQLMNFSVAAIWLSLKAVPISSRPQFGAVRTTCRGRRMSPRARRDCHLERCWTHAQPVHSRTPFGETGHTTQLPCAFDTS